MNGAITRANLVNITGNTTLNGNVSTATTQVYGDTTGTDSVTVGGGEAVDVIIDTADVEPGTYFLYTTNLNYLSNKDEARGGMMTEIVIRSAAAN